MSKATIADSIDTLRKRVAAITTSPRAVKLNNFITATHSESTLEDGARTALAELDKSIQDEKARAAGSELIRAAYAQNQDGAKRSLNALRVEAINNLLLPTVQFAGMFFRVVTLKPDEEPVYINNTQQEVDITVINEEGRAETRRAIRPNTPVPIPLKMYGSAEYTFPEIDVYQGNVVDQALLNVDIARDFRVKIDTLAKAVAASAFNSAWPTATALQDKVFNPHSAINTANLPAGNKIAVGSGGYRKAVFDAVVRYVTKWGQGAFQDGDLQIDGSILVPSGQASAIGEGIEWTGVYGAGTIQDNIQKSGFLRINHLGHVFTTVPDNTLESDWCYARTNKPLGTIYIKPALDVDNTEDHPQLSNFKRRYQKKVLGFVCPAQWQPHAIQIGYAA